MAFMYKVQHGKVGISNDMLGLEKADPRTRRKHRFKLKTHDGSTPNLKNSFVNRSIPEWNQLPASMAEAVSLNSLKEQLAARLP